MNQVEPILRRIQELGNPGTARVLMNHGARPPVYGARIGDMKPLVRGIRSDPDLARALFDSGVYDAMYLAALVVDGADLGEETLDRWAQLDYGGSISASTVPWVAVEHPLALGLALGWIDSPQENTTVTGWSTLAGLAATKDDGDLDLPRFRELIHRAGARIPSAPTPSARAMAAFVVSVAVYVEPLRDTASAVAASVGPEATVPIAKALGRGPVKKRKTMKC